MDNDNRYYHYNISDIFHIIIISFLTIVAFNEFNVNIIIGEIIAIESVFTYETNYKYGVDKAIIYFIYTLFSITSSFGIVYMFEDIIGIQNMPSMVVFIMLFFFVIKSEVIDVNFRKEGY